MGGEPLTEEKAVGHPRPDPSNSMPPSRPLNRDYRRQGRPYTVQLQGRGTC